MKRLEKIISILCLLLIAVITTGCSNKDIYPASDIQITSVSPSSILPNTKDFSSIDEGTISMQLLNSIPCELVSYDISYKTALDEPITGISLNNIPVNIPLTGEGSTADLTLKPYSQQLINIFENTPSNISPVKATVSLHFKDVNKNETTRYAFFVLYKFTETASSE